LRAGSAVEGIAFSADGKTLAVRDDAGTHSLWNVTARVPTSTAMRGAGSLSATCMALPPDGSVLTSAGVGTYMVWETGVRRTRMTSMGGARGGGCAAVSADGKTIAWCPN